MRNLLLICVLPLVSGCFLQSRPATEYAIGLERAIDPVKLLHRRDTVDLKDEYLVILTATGVPHLIEIHLAALEEPLRWMHVPNRRIENLRWVAAISQEQLDALGGEALVSVQVIPTLATRQEMSYLYINGRQAVGIRLRQDRSFREQIQALKQRNLQTASR